MVASGIALMLVGFVEVSCPPPSAAQMQGMKMGQGKGGAMPAACQEMMAMRQSMRAEQVNADAKLNDLVAKMNAASGENKVDTIAAVISEMVAQRQARHEKMAGMDAKMKAAMANCPMMQQGAAAPTGPEKAPQ